LPHLWPTGSSLRQPSSITARHFSSSPSDSTSRWTPCPPEINKKRLQIRLGCVLLSLSCPFRLLHTFSFLLPARHYSRVWIWRSSSERQWDFNPHEQCAAQHTLRPLLTSPPLSRKEISPGKVQNLSPRAAWLYRVRLDDLWASLWVASLPPASGLTASSCSYGREFVSRFFQLHLAVYALRFTTVAVIGSDWLLACDFLPWWLDVRCLNQSVSECVGFDLKSFDSVLLISLLKGFRPFVHVGLSPAQQAVDENG
jgi:hypothetical protein